MANLQPPLIGPQMPLEAAAGSVLLRTGWCAAAASMCTTSRKSREGRNERTKPSGVTWPDSHNRRWNLELDEEIGSDEHLTTWTGFTNEANFKRGRRAEDRGRRTAPAEETRLPGVDQNCATEANFGRGPKLRDRSQLVRGGWICLIGFGIWSSIKKSKRMST